MKAEPKKKKLKTCKHSLFHPVEGTCAYCGKEIVPASWLIEKNLPNILTDDQDNTTEEEE